LEKDNIIIRDLSLAKLSYSIKKDSFDGIIIEAFEIFILMHTLADNLKEANSNLLKE
jgi:hypothetical protein